MAKKKTGLLAPNNLRIGGVLFRALQEVICDEKDLDEETKAKLLDPKEMKKVDPPAGTDAANLIEEAKKEAGIILVGAREEAQKILEEAQKEADALKAPQGDDGKKDGDPAKENASS